MVRKESFAERILKHGVCAAAVTLLLAVALALAGAVLQRSVADVVIHAQDGSVIYGR